MPASKSTAEIFDVLANVLLHCWVFGFMLLCIWFGVFALAGDIRTPVRQRSSTTENPSVFVRSPIFARS